VTLLTVSRLVGGLLLAAGLFALLIAKLTISYQSIKASVINPVESLKDQ
jgi:hypothetical protein